MQYLYEHFSFPRHQSFTIRSEILELKHYTQLKLHANFEIALLENCSGRRIIGNHTGHFQGGDLVLLGSFLPHCWQYEPPTDPLAEPRATVIHFYPDFLGIQFLEKPEGRLLNDLFAKAAKGISYSGDTIAKAKPIMEELLHTDGLHRVIPMINLLCVLLKSDEETILNSETISNALATDNMHKINKAIEYVLQNFREEITLVHAARIAGKSPSAFCRTFKQYTNRTFFDFVREVRIGHAAMLIQERKYSISEICYSSGYNNLSNFNKHFKILMGTSPRGLL